MAAIPSTTTTLLTALETVRITALDVKTFAQNFLAALQGPGANSAYVFQLIDRLSQAKAAMNSAAALGQPLNNLAAAQWPSYAGSLTADIAAVAGLIDTVVSWIAANFPAAGGYLQAESFNPDGSRTQRVFGTAGTAPLMTALQNLVNAIA